MRREKHVKSFLKRLAAGAAATLMAVTTIIVNVEPMKARANDGYYTVIDQYNEFYGSVFGDLDPDMPGWWSTHFTVEDSDGETYSAMCAQPHVKTGLVKKNEQKSDDFVFSINVVSGAYFMYKDNLVEYNAENPNLMQYKDSILEDLGLSKDIYTVESIEWTSEPEADADGMIHREATVKGYKEIADYEATYVATVDYPTANVVYTADYEADTTKNTTFYEIKGTATYQLTSEIVDTNASGTKKTDFKSVFKNPVVVGSFSAVVIVIIAVIAIVLWKKKSEKEVVE